MMSVGEFTFDELTAFATVYVNECFQRGLPAPDFILRANGRGEWFMEEE